MNSVCSCNLLAEIIMIYCLDPQAKPPEGTPTVSGLEYWVTNWVSQHIMSTSDVDCATTVMLKILDGKCKMKVVEKRVMAALYDAVRDLDAEQMGAEMHGMIDEVRWDLSEENKNRVYEKRVLAETMISRPVMKEFKARIRQQGLFDMPEALLQQLSEETD